MQNVHTMLTDYTEAKEAWGPIPRTALKRTARIAKYHTKDLIFILVVSLALTAEPSLFPQSRSYIH